MVDFRAGLDDAGAYHRLVCGIRGMAPDAGSAPAPPPHRLQPYRSMAPASDEFVHRRELDAVRDLLVDAAGGTVGITMALRGAGGFGKTALAQALCEDVAVREAYPAGILWAHMRDDMSDAGRLAVVQDLIRFWHAGETQRFETLPAASTRRSRCRETVRFVCGTCRRAKQSPSLPLMFSPGSSPSRTAAVSSSGIGWVAFISWILTCPRDEPAFATRRLPEP